MRLRLAGQRLRGRGRRRDDRSWPADPQHGGDTGSGRGVASGAGCRRRGGRMTKRAVTYASYLGLEQLLSAQKPRSSGPDGRPEHDELLFIVIHQVYGLWFKQLLHELAEVQRTLESGDTDTTLHLLNRVLKILKTLVAQIDVLETMTPLQFTSFRDRLESASGFQSAQFREIEAVLGRRDASAAAAQPAGSEGRQRIEAAQGRRSV